MSGNVCLINDSPRYSVIDQARQQMHALFSLRALTILAALSVMMPMLVILSSVLQPESEIWRHIVETLLFDLLKNTVSEYKTFSKTPGMKINERLDTEQLVLSLSKEHEWTNQGAQAIVYLAKEYGVFMLRNALALAIILEKEDGNLGF